MPTLALKCEKDSDPLRLVGEMEDEPTILPDAVVPLESAQVSLIHVDIVNASVWAKAKIFIGRCFRSPFLTKRKKHGGFIRKGTLDNRVQFVVEIVVWPWRIIRQRHHSHGVKEVATNKIQATPCWRSL
jgi:hypothetical protein